MPLFYSKRLPTGGVRIRRADGGSAEDMDSFRELAELHAAGVTTTLGIDVREVQPFDAEMASLPAPYDGSGFILLA